MSRLGAVDGITAMEDYIFQHPLDNDPPVSQEFGENPDNYSKYNYGGHNGRDFAVPIGTEVRNCSNGKVVVIGWDPGGYGNYIKIWYKWGAALYAHLSKISTHVGDYLSRGEVIGFSGNSGNSTGPHLHFEIYEFDPRLAEQFFDWYSKGGD